MRSQLVERVRSVASKVLRLPDEYFRLDYERSNVPELQVLLKFDISRRDVSKFAPILYPSTTRARRNDKKFFLAEELAKVHIHTFTHFHSLILSFMTVYEGRSFWPSFT